MTAEIYFDRQNPADMGWAYRAQLDGPEESAGGLEGYEALSEADGPPMWAVSTTHGWVVEDAAGEAWAPGPRAQELILGSEDPESAVLALCLLRPDLGRW